MNTNDEQVSRPTVRSHESRADLTHSLGRMRRGDIGRVLAVRSGEGDLERGLLEMGFVEGARIEVLHQGLWGRDPLAVRINHGMTVALRRCEANAVLIGPLHDPAANPHSGMSLEYASS